MKEAIEAALKEHQLKFGVRDLHQHCICGWRGATRADVITGHQAEVLQRLLSLAEDDAVERAARSLCAAEFPDVSPSYAWGVQFEDGQHHYREMARAAIAAFKETRT